MRLAHTSANGRRTRPLAECVQTSLLSDRELERESALHVGRAGRPTKAFYPRAEFARAMLEYLH
jgi:hypothetical protein